MRVISQDSMGISIYLHYVRIHVTSRTTEITRVKEKPGVDMLLYICIYARLKVMFGKVSVSAIPCLVDLSVSLLSVSFTILMNIYRESAMITRMRVASFIRRSFRLAYERILTNA